MRVASLFVYPVKSARGISLERARVLPTGIAGDRHVMIVGPDGGFITQREEPCLARVAVAVDEARGTVTLTSGSTSVEVSCASDPAASPLVVTLWQDTLVAEDAGASAAELLSLHAGRPLRLVRFGAAASRPLAPRYGEGDTTKLADGSPVLVATLASLAALGSGHSRRAPPALTRFRANVVVDGIAPFEEESASHLTLGDGPEAVVLRLVKPCPRCSVIDVDPETGVREKGTLAALARLRPPRSAEEREEGEKRAVHFGVDAVVERPGTAHVGDLARFS